MKFKQFKVTDECIGCMACVGIAGSVFKMNGEGKAFVAKQPETADEEQLAEEALEACPVDAIVASEAAKTGKQADLKPVLADDNVKEILDKYPELKTILADLSPRFKRLQNPVLYNTLAKFTSFRDAAKITGVSLCVILHTVNKFLGTEEQLYHIMPECIKAYTGQEPEAELQTGEPVTWEESRERYVLTGDNQDSLLEMVSNLRPGGNIVVISVDPPDLLVKMAIAKEFKYNLEKGREYRLSIFNPQRIDSGNWQQMKDSFEVLDVRFMKTDPFEVIIKKANHLEPGQGFVLMQSFVPYPIIRMLTEMGFEYEIEQSEPENVKVYFFKKPQEQSEYKVSTVTKPEIVLQSATPVAYPVIMRLLQSERLQRAVRIRDLKVWSETEKHLGWIVNGKADISFSAVITSNKLRDLDVKFPAVVVWDNFVLLTRGYTAKSWADVKGHEIYLPLFADAPPAKITRYLIKAAGFNPEEFTFKYGKPFGRPEQIYADLVLGRIDTAVLREPEASFAIKIMEDQQVEFSELRFDRLWNDANPGFGSFPNAGVVIKGEFLRKYPETGQLFLEELHNAVDWVVENREEAARLSFDIMRQPPDRVLRFLQRVTFMYQDGVALRSKIKKYFEVLVEQDILQARLDDKFLGIFG